MARAEIYFKDEKQKKEYKEIAKKEGFSLSGFIQHLFDNFKNFQKSKLILLLFIGVNCFGQELKTDFSIESGLANYSHSIFYQDQTFIYQNIARVRSEKISFYSDINFILNYNNFHLSNNIINLFRKSQKIFFDPKQVEYIINLNYRIDKYENYKFEFGYKHSCSHHVGSAPNELDSKYRASYNRIYIKIETN